MTTRIRLMIMLGVWLGAHLPAYPAYGPPASYGPLASVPATEHPPAVPPAPDAWKNATYAMVTSELSPAVLYVNRSREQHLFSRLNRWRLGGPTSIAYAGPDDSIQSQSAREILIQKPEMAEPWLLVWFHDSEGWTHWDSPWLVVLQRAPTHIRTDPGGLHLTFEREAGIVAAMPLYGYYKPAHGPRRSELLKDPSRINVSPLTRRTGDGSLAGVASAMPARIETGEWLRVLPGEVIARASWWSRVLRRYPLHCREAFSVDRSRDRLTLRETFTWLPIEDDWKTKPIQFAPLSPTLALAYGDKRFPMKVSEPVTDPDLMTPYGPYLGVEGKDSYAIDLDVLQYVHETEVQQEPDLLAHPAARPALDYVRKAMAEKFPDDSGKWAVDFGPENFCWAAMADRWYPKGLAYVDDTTRANALKSLRNYFSEWVLKEERFRPFRGMLLLVGPGIGTWGGYDDAGKFSSNKLETVWSYAHYTGDWDLVRDRWPLLQRLFITPLESDWKTFGRAAIAELGDEAAPALAYARMAYRIGDADAYLYGCYIFGRELLHHFVKQDKAEYFRRRGPFHSMEPMPENVYLTNLWGDTAGWQIDGPTYPKETRERQYNNRWVRFGNEDVARFHREALPEETKRELDGLLKTGASPHKPGNDDAHIAPSMERLRSLLLNERPEELAKLTPPEKWSSQPNSGKVALGLSFLRTTRPPRYARIIPKEGKPSPFALGLERQVEGGFSGLVQNPVWERKTKDGASEAYWPTPVWHFWKPLVSPEDHPAGERWPFGESRPEGPERPRSGQTTRLNWNTQVTTFDF